MLRTNYRCVQYPNISVDVTKCREKFHKFTQHTHFLQTKSGLCLRGHPTLPEFVKLFPTFGDVYTDVGVLYTSVVCS